MNLNSAEINTLVDALLECDCMKTINSRASVIQGLPPAIQHRLRGGGTSRQDVDEIVRACAQFSGGLESLLQRVKFFEAGSHPWGNVEQVTRGASGSPEAPQATASTATPHDAAIDEPVQVFFSYSHKDEELRDALNAHLSILKRQKVISAWHDRQIPPGAEWAAEIDARIDQAGIILLLVSADFLASDYCHEIEMKRALERHERGEAVVIPVILRPCDWRGALFGKLNALPRDARAVTSWPNRDEALQNIAEGIRRVVERLRAR
ncbi:MAG: toll/interleukin-1 receptor domain-containing protein [Blastocatellia bacterium]